MLKNFFVNFLFLSLIFSHPIIVDGDPSDWIGELPPVDAFWISNGEGIWHDSPNDDLGDGGDAPYADDSPSSYSYPDTNLYSRHEADILEWRVTYDPQNQFMYFLFRLGGFVYSWQPILAIMIDLDHIPGSGQDWIPQMADLKVHPMNAWEVSIIIADGFSYVLNSDWTPNPAVTLTYANPSNGIIEVGVQTTPWLNQNWCYFTVVSGLGDFGHFREVDYSSSTWFGGGGIGINGQDTGYMWIEPDVYDILFVPASFQHLDLNSYTNTIPAVMREASSLYINLVQLQVLEANNINPRIILTKIGKDLLIKLLDADINSFTLCFYNSLGSLIFEREFSSNIGVLSYPLKKGIYFLTIHDKKGRIFKLKYPEL